MKKCRYVRVYVCVCVCATRYDLTTCTTLLRVKKTFFLHREKMKVFRAADYCKGYLIVNIFIKTDDPFSLDHRVYTNKITLRRQKHARLE